jgi:hypothetical protein
VFGCVPFESSARISQGNRHDACHHYQRGRSIPGHGDTVFNLSFGRYEGLGPESTVERLFLRTLLPCGIDMTGQVLGAVVAAEGYYSFAGAEFFCQFDSGDNVQAG